MLFLTHPAAKYKQASHSRTITLNRCQNEIFDNQFVDWVTVTRTLAIVLFEHSFSLPSFTSQLAAKYIYAVNRQPRSRQTAVWSNTHSHLRCLRPFLHAVKYIPDNQQTTDSVLKNSTFITCTFRLRWNEGRSSGLSFACYSIAMIAVSLCCCSSFLFVSQLSLKSIDTARQRQSTSIVYRSSNSSNNSNVSQH